MHASARNSTAMRRSLLTLCLSTAALVGGCAYDYDAGYGYPQQGYYQDRPYAPPQAALHVPPGHMPPPGWCRIWYPGYPPGQQPPPGACHRLRHRVPPGAVLIHG